MSLKISALPDGVAAQGTDILPVARAGANARLTVANLQAYMRANAAGSAGQLLYNNAGAVAGSANLTFDGTTLTAAGFAGPLLGNVTGNVSGSAASATTAVSISGTVGADHGGTGVVNNAASTITVSGSFGLTLTLSALTAVTLPTSGTLLATNGNGSGLSSVNAATLLGSTWASPAAIGTTASAAGTFTVLTVNGGTLVASAPGLTITQTLNNAAVVFTALKINVTNTASAAGSLLQDSQVAGVSKFSVDLNGGIQSANAGQLLVRDGGGIQVANASNTAEGFKSRGQTALASGGQYGWVANSNGSGAYDTSLSRNASGIVEINNGAAGTFRDLKLRTLICGATQATTMTDGFIQVPGAAGAATGVPTDTTGVPLYYDKTNNKLYAYNGAWKASGVFS